MEAVPRLLRGVTLTMNVRDRMLRPVVRLACDGARACAVYPTSATCLTPTAR